MSHPTLGFRCPDDACDAPVAARLDPPPREARCGRCGSVTRLKDGIVGEGGRLERCGACGGRAFWLKKNFRSEYGCLILIVAAVFMDATYQLSLPAAVLLDFVLYQFLGDVAVCYRCKAEVRGTPRNPAHRAFDLHHATDLDKEIHRQGGAKATIDWSKGAAAQPSLT